MHEHRLDRAPDDGDDLVAAIEASTAASRPHAGLVRALRGAGLAGALLVGLLGVIVLFGWLTQFDGSFWPAELKLVKVNTAISLVALSAALVLVGRRRAHRLAWLLIALGVLIAGLTLVEWIADVSLGLDNPTGLDPHDTGVDEPPGRMSLVTTVALLVVWVSVAFLQRGWVKASQALGAVTVSLAGVILIGYAYGVDSLYEFGPFSTVALPTALSLLLTGGSVILLRSGQGLMSLITSSTAGGLVARRLMPLGVLAPVVIGLVVVEGLRRDYYEGAVAIALFAAALGSSTAAVVVIQSLQLRSIDLRRAGAEQAYALAREALQDRDAMAQKASAAERRTLSILDAAADTYIALDREGHVVAWNRAATGVFGWTHEEAIGQTLDVLILGNLEGSVFRDSLHLYHETGATSLLGQRLEFPAQTKSGARLAVDMVVWEVPDGDTPYFHTFVRDVTDRKAAEEDLRRANADLADFSAAMAHDLRGPLTVIKSYAELMETSGSPAQSEDWLRRIDAAADRGVLLIDDILTFAGIGRRKSERVSLDLGSLIAVAMSDQLIASGRDACVEVGTLPQTVGDPALLRLLFDNLIGNALKYVPSDRKAEVVVDGHVDERTGGVIVRVRDNGDAIAEQDRDIIFDMFRRGVATGDAIGSGVGLAICRRIAEIHEGRIWLESPPAGGNMFCVRLGRLSLST